MILSQPQNHETTNANLISEAAHSACLTVPAKHNDSSPFEYLQKKETKEFTVSLKANSHFTFIDKYTSAHKDLIIKFDIAEGATLNYFQIIDFDLDTPFNITQNFHLKKDAHVTMTHFFLNGSVGKIKSDISCDEGGSRFEFMGAARLDKKQSLAHSITTSHLAPNTYSSFEYLTVLADEAHSLFEGLITIPKNSINTESFQKNRNLLLSKDAKAESIPRLEIATDEVKCAHGASTSPVNEEQIYYLTSRGISHNEAELMIINGFTNPVLARVPLETTREYIKKSLSQKHQIIQLSNNEFNDFSWDEVQS